MTSERNPVGSASWGSVCAGRWR